VSSGGPYDCVDGAISPKVARAGPKRFEGRYDPATGILTWDGHAFERVIWNGRDFERVSRDGREPERAK
jgi:hypothetical protein